MGGCWITGWWWLGGWLLVSSSQAFLGLSWVANDVGGGFSQVICLFFATISQTVIHQNPQANQGGLVLSTGPPFFSFPSRMRTTSNGHWSWAGQISRSEPIKKIQEIHPADLATPLGGKNYRPVRISESLME